MIICLGIPVDGEVPVSAHVEMLPMTATPTFLIATPERTLTADNDSHTAGRPATRTTG
jgi:hypothetical protein